MVSSSPPPSTASSSVTKVRSLMMSAGSILGGSGSGSWDPSMSLRALRASRGTEPGSSAGAMGADFVKPAERASRAPSLLRDLGTT
uniref:Uncharacterized protein n=1 Tax=Anguilla anguilla TaxID=7936 RepID=A0A0E9VPW2_ANGAN